MIRGADIQLVKVTECLSGLKKCNNYFVLNCASTRKQGQTVHIRRGCIEKQKCNQSVETESRNKETVNAQNMLKNRIYADALL